MLYNTEAIVIRSIVYGETHAIVTLLTPSGVVAAMARGAKKPQSRFAAGVQLCVEALFTISQRSGMGTVQQLEIVQSRRKLRERLDLAAYAAYFCELVQAVAPERPHGSEAVYRLFIGALDRLQRGEDKPDLLARVWEAKVLHWLGAAPDWRLCVRCGQSIQGTPAYSAADGGLVCSLCLTTDSSRGSGVIPVSHTFPRILDAFARVPWERLGSIRVSPENLKKMSRILQIQMQEYAGISPKSRGFLESISDVMSDSDE